MKTTVCPHCGRSHPTNARFCPVTGNTIPAPPADCPQCGQKLESNWMVCPNCGLMLPAVSIKPPLWSMGPPLQRVRVTRLWTLATGGAILFLILVCGSAYLLSRLYRTNQTARIVPDDTGVLISISPSLLQLPQLRNEDNIIKVATLFAAVPEIAEAVVAIQSNLPLDLNMEPEKDVLPWIGPEVSLALFYNNRYSNDLKEKRPGSGVVAKPDTATNQVPPMMLAIATRNQKSSDGFLERLRSQLETGEVEFGVDNYQDTRITEIISPGHIPLAYATFNGLVVIATNAEIIHSAIDTSHENNPRVLYKQEAYREAMEKLPGNRLGYIYLNWPVYVKQSGAEEIVQVFPAGNLYAIEKAGVAFSLNEEGLRLDYVARYDLDELSQAQIETYRQAPSLNQLAGLMPNNSLFYISGQDLPLTWRAFAEGKYWQEVSDALRFVGGFGVGTYPDDSDLIQEIERETNVHVTKDLLDKIPAEYAWDAIHDPNGLFGYKDIPFGLLFYAQVDDRPRVEQSLLNLIEATIQDEEVYMYKDEFNNRDVWLLKGRHNEVEVGYGFIGDTLFIGSSRHALRAASQTEDDHLLENQLFQSTVSVLPDSRGLIYVDVQEMIQAYYPMMSTREKESFNRGIRPYIESVQAIAMTKGDLDGEGWLHGTLFMNTIQP